MSNHFPIGGSKIELIEICPGSVAAGEPYKDIPAGPAAQRGTRVHSYIELLWTQEYSGRKLTKEDKDLIKTLSEDERQVGLAMREALKEVCKREGFAPEEIHVEKQFSFIGEIAGGTPDAFAYQAFGNLLVVDFKTGHKQVSADENLQLLFYACSVVRNMDAFTASTLENVILVILQPEDDAPIVTTRSWATTMEELATYDARFVLAVDMVIANPEKRTGGYHCADKWCPARATCSAHLAWLSEGTGFEAALAGSGVTPEGQELANFLAKLPSIKSWIEAVQSTAKDALRVNPESVPGWTLTDSIGHRAWTNEKEVEKALKLLGLKSADYKTSKLLSPAQAEKMLKIKKLDTDAVMALTERPVTGQTLKPGTADVNTRQEQLLLAASGV